MKHLSFTKLVTERATQRASALSGTTVPRENPLLSRVLALFIFFKRVTQCVACRTIGKAQACVRRACFLYQGLVAWSAHTIYFRFVFIESYYLSFFRRSLLFLLYSLAAGQYLNLCTYTFAQNTYTMKFTSSFALVCLSVASVEAFVLPPQHEWMVRNLYLLTTKRSLTFI